MGRPLLVFQGKNWKCKIYYRLPFESNIDKQKTCNEYWKNDVNVLKIILNCYPIYIFPRYEDKKFFAENSISMYAVNSTCKMIGVFSKMSCKISYTFSLDFWEVCYVYTCIVVKYIL